MTGTKEIDGIVRAVRQAHREFASCPDVAAETRQAVAQAVRFLVADLESAQAMTGAALAMAK
jgi:predicted neutral ceramidase superfamily lipid hydrolase